MSFTVEDLLPMTLQAGVIVLRHFEAGTKARKKSDRSPVTDADEEAERLILEELSRLAPTIPVIAEEQAAAGRLPEIGTRFFLVDPLDGTKEFVKRSGDFTVNIALIENGRPVMGVVYAPARGELYYGTVGKGAFRRKGTLETLAAAEPERLSVRCASASTMTAVVSSSHINNQTKDYLKTVKAAHTVSVGSSLKFCIVAAGEADVYPRLGPTMEWDTAAGHAVLAAAGGTVELPDGAPLLYGKADAGYLNPFFIARGQ